VNARLNVLNSRAFLAPRAKPTVLSVRAALASATAELAAAGVASPRTDAELLAAHALGIARSRLVLVDDFTPEQLVVFRRLLAERAARTPLQHLIGHVAFGDIDIDVGPGAFIPRPETELLVAWALAKPPEGSPVIVDLCSGTGAIALAMAHALPDATVYAVEQDVDAAVWLRRNAAAQAVAGDRPIEIMIGDVTDPRVPPLSLDGTVDLLLCNPPYVPDGTPVPDEVLHDPRVAVFGGPDGLAVIGPVVTRSVSLVKPGGWLAIEHDDVHATAVADLLVATNSYAEVEVHHDLAGRPRFTTARRMAH
jgi:release factor glutamine methyltransferase